MLIVGLGGFIGSALRYLISGWAQSISNTPWFPAGTLAVNVIGCLAVGILGGWADNIGLFNASTRLFILLGILGGFTTYSTFGYETLALVRDREIFAALINVIFHLIFGLGAVWLGYALSTIKG